MTWPRSGRAATIALAAARGADGSAIWRPRTIARHAMAIAADICVYTNGNLTVETIKA